MPTLNAQSAIRAIVVSLDGDVLDLLDRLPQYNIVGFVDAFRRSASFSPLTFPQCGRSSRRIMVSTG
jgi:hypothetical protein